MALAATARRHDLIAIDLHDPVEYEIPRVGVISLEDAETGEMVWVDTDSEEWRWSYGVGIAERQLEKIQSMNSLGVDRIDLTTGEPYVAGLNEFFHRRAVRLSR